MNKNTLSKSKYCKGVQCEKILWLDNYGPKLSQEMNNDAILENGRKVGKLAKGLFGEYVDIPYDDDSVMIEKTEHLLEDKPNVITEATFSYDDNLCRVDILKNDVDGVEIYEVKSTTDFNKIDMNDPAFQYFVLTNLGLNVKKVCVVYLNKDYIMGKELDIQQLFKKEDVTPKVKENQDEIRNNIDFIKKYLDEYGREEEPV
jgi:hypothetical protein